MGVNGVADLVNLIPVITSPKIYAELRNQIMFSSFFEREYEGEISSCGQIVKVNQIVAPSGEILTSDKAEFASSDLEVTQQSITCDKIAVASFDITDLAQIQSLEFEAQMVEALSYAVRQKLEGQILAAMLPSTSSPDHDIAPAAASDLAAADLGSLRTLLSAAKVPVTGRGLFLAPSYYGDLLSKTQLTSLDFVPGQAGASGVLSNFMGFNIMEHNLLAADVGYACHPSALQVVMQRGVTVKVSDLHPLGRLGYKVSAHMIFGVKLMDNKRLAKISA